MRRTVPFVLLTLMVFAVAPAAAQPAPSADLNTRDVHTNFMESFSATVRNLGAEDITVMRVSVTIDWPGWAPTLYPIFEGREVVRAGDDATFTGPAIRSSVTRPQ